MEIVKDNKKVSSSIQVKVDGKWLSIASAWNIENILCLPKLILAKPLASKVTDWRILQGTKPRRS